MLREREGGHFLHTDFGVCCPICGNRIARGSFFCRRCRRSGRLHLDSNDIRAKAKDIHLPHNLHR